MCKLARVGATALLLAVASLPVWASTDWNLLARSGQLLFGSTGLHVYVRESALQAGPVALATFGVLQKLGATVGPLLVHAAMWSALALALHWAGGSHRPQHPAANVAAKRKSTPYWAIVVIGALPVLTWHLPPFGRGEQLLWLSCALILAVALALPSAGMFLRRRVALTREQWCGLLLLGTWAMLASGTAHLEDACATCLLFWSARDSERGNHLRAAVLVGVAMGFKPWAIGGLAVLLRRDRPALVVRDFSVAGAVVVGAWLPFVIAAPATIHAAARPFGVMSLVPLSLVLPAGGAPPWLRTMQMAGIVLASFIARRRGRADAIAAGLCARLLLDPTNLSYYASTALLGIAGADLANHRPARRLTVALVGLWLLPCLSLSSTYVAIVKAATLVALLASYAGRPSPAPSDVGPRLPAPNPITANERDPALANA